MGRLCEVVIDSETHLSEICARLCDLGIPTTQERSGGVLRLNVDQLLIVEPTVTRLTFHARVLDAITVFGRMTELAFYGRALAEIAADEGYTFIDHPEDELLDDVDLTKAVLH